MKNEFESFSFLSGLIPEYFFGEEGKDEYGDGVRDLSPFSVSLPKISGF